VNFSGTPCAEKITLIEIPFLRVQKNIQDKIKFFLGVSNALTNSSILLQIPLLPLQVRAGKGKSKSF